MLLSAFVQALDDLTSLQFRLNDGATVPAHFHITEVGLTTKYFMDCGGTIRQEQMATLQIWVADDVEHRLVPSKLVRIIGAAAPLFGGSDPEVELEFQTQTIGRYGVALVADTFVLQPRYTACLAEDVCGIPAVEEFFSSSMFEISASGSVCKPGGGCC